MNLTAGIPELEARIAHYVKDDAPGLALLIGEKGKVVYRGGFGLADQPNRIPVTPEHSFLIGSVTKQFTGMAVMMLKERGLLSYDEPLARFFPSFPASIQAVTIRHLLTHTGGIKEYLVDSFWAQPDSVRAAMTQEQLLKLIRGYGDLDFAPGTRWSYSNSGYVLLGAIIEQLSGQTFPDFITGMILKPLGMHRTTAPVSPEQPVGNRALGYRREPGGRIIATPYDMVTIGWADGNLVSTVDDLFIWHKALNTEKLVRRVTLAEAFRPYILTDGRSTNYGFGWISNCRRGLKESWHSGGTDGYISRFARFVEQDIAIIMLTNCQGPAWDEVYGAITEVVLADRMDPLPLVGLPEADLQAKVGVYGSEDGTVRAEYDPEHRKLKLNLALARLAGQYPLSPISGQEFRVDTPADYYVKFIGDANAPTGMELDLNGRQTVLLRSPEQPCPR